MNRPICYAPFIGLYAKPESGNYAPCCFSKQKTERYQSISDYWNAERTRNTRKKLLAGEWPTDCEYCKLRQNTPMNTDIPMWNRLFEKAKRKSEIKLDVDSGNNHNRPFQIDVRPSNICNLKCRMCGQSNSSQIEAEIKKFPVLEEFYGSIKDRNDSDDFIEFLNKCNLVKLKILGGEPTIDKKVLEILDKIISNYSYHEQPEIDIVTNGTTFNKKFRNQLHNIKNIKIKFSVDATETCYEYIRTNAKWTKVNRNIRWITKKYNFTFGFNSVIMPYNIFFLDRLLEWYYDLSRHCDFFVNFVSSQQYFTDISSILNEDIEFAREKVELLVQKNPNIQDVNGFGILMSILDNHQFEEQNHLDFIKYNRTLDSIRQTKLVELHDRFKKYI
jgi:sulfatase maturation enzyme AslB (radical SAM superfamily)